MSLDPKVVAEVIALLPQHMQDELNKGGQAELPEGTIGREIIEATWTVALATLPLQEAAPAYEGDVDALIQGLNV